MKAEGWLTSSRAYWILFGQYILLSSAIFLRAYFDVDGYLSADSIAYLSQAQSYLQDFGMYSGLSLWQYLGDSNYFATWPTGYPFLIYLVAETFNLSVFWASKTLNAILLGGCMLLLLKMFGRRAPIYCGLLFSATFFKIFSYTWSEVPFVFGLLWFVAAIGGYWEKTSYKNLLNLLLAMLFLFLSRYIGIFIFLTAFILMMHFYVRQNYAEIGKLTAVVLVCFVFVSAYIAKNYIETGYLTGTARSAPSASALNQMLIVSKALVFQINLLQAKNVGLFLLTIIIQLFIFKPFIQSLRANRLRPEAGIPRLSKILFWVGGCYYTMIITLSVMRDMDDLGYRLLGPGTLLLLLGFTHWIEQKQPSLVWRQLTHALIITFSLNYICYVPLQILDAKIIKEEATYTESVQQLLHRYTKVGHEEVVLGADPQMQYLRMDVISPRKVDIDSCNLENRSLESIAQCVSEKFRHRRVFIDTEGLKNLNYLNAQALEEAKTLPNRALVIIH